MYVVVDGKSVLSERSASGWPNLRPWTAMA